MGPSESSMKSRGTALDWTGGGARVNSGHNERIKAQVKIKEGPISISLFSFYSLLSMWRERKDNTEAVDRQRRIKWDISKIKKDRNIHGSNCLIHIQRKWLPNGKDYLSLFSLWVKISPDPKLSFPAAYLDDCLDLPRSVWYSLPPPFHARPFLISLIWAETDKHGSVIQP